MKESKLKESVDLIREVFYYSHRFKGEIFVIKIDYSIIDHPNFPTLVKDLAMLKQAGIHIVIIPGADGHINSILKQYNIKTREVDGVRISTPESIPFIKMAAFDVSNRVMTMLSGQKIPAVIGNWVKAHGKGVVDGVDYQETGVVEKVNLSPLKKVIQDGLVPIFPCIGWNSMGKPYNISSNALALEVSSTLQAGKLFFTGEHEKLKGINRMNLREAEKYIKNNEDSLLLQKALRACKSGVKRVHIIDGRIEGVILKEIFSNTGVGTMIHSNAYEQIRPMKPDDAQDVLKLMTPFIHEGILIPRSLEDIKGSCENSVVYEIDGTVHACGALNPMENRMAELAGLVSDTSSKIMGAGKAVADYLIEKARMMGMEKVFVLTTHTADWFEQQGFQKGDPADLPESKKEAYNTKRNSRVYFLDIKNRVS